MRSARVCFQAATAAAAASSTASSSSAEATSASTSAETPSTTPPKTSSPKLWHVNEIIKSNEALGQMTTTILKFDHPYRMQRVMIVPTPRFATEDFYKDWCYQPYVKDHQLRVSNDIFNPAFVALPRIVLNASAKTKSPKKSTTAEEEAEEEAEANRNETSASSSTNASSSSSSSSAADASSSSSSSSSSAAAADNNEGGFYQGLKYFTPLYMPDAIDNNVTRREFISREQNFNTFTPLMMLTTNNFREKWHPWIKRKTRKMVGERYLSHPKEDKQSFVVLVPPHYAATMATTLSELGFKVADSMEVPYGKIKPLKRLHFWGDFCLFAVLSYFWIVISVMIVNESIRFYYALREYQAHLILLAGKNPLEYGYTQKEFEAAQEKMRTQ